MSHHHRIVRALLTGLLLAGWPGQPLVGSVVAQAPTAAAGAPPVIRVEQGVVTADRQGRARLPGPFPDLMPYQ
ncbi:hypothetical protein [Candidatus Methylomirabilis sp.]|uniref:hypothetical protein n=1 Tax=Candidatus Methylomirabilis sp. TaxID=2032687 RepID=UPI0030761566